MAQQLEIRQGLYQEEVVYEIESKFGPEFVYINNNGNPAIDRKVLKEFRQLTPNAVWERGDRLWRKREGYDESSSRTQD
ncbi:MAG: hypothetical protein IIA60_07655 [Candidatus Marinimicrobia bacterium]|nr:hypothetical protein [Candidatus Neomarinimicrobiota bacterium]